MYFITGYNTINMFTVWFRLTLAVQNLSERSEEEQGRVFSSNSLALLRHVGALSGPTPAFGSRWGFGCRRGWFYFLGSPEAFFQSET